MILESSEQITFISTPSMKRFNEINSIIRKKQIEELLYLNLQPKKHYFRINKEHTNVTNIFQYGRTLGK